MSTPVDKKGICILKYSFHCLRLRDRASSRNLVLKIRHTSGLTEEGFLELAAGVEDPGDLLEVEKEAGDDVESVDEAEREEEAPSAVKDAE